MAGTDAKQPDRDVLTDPAELEGEPGVWRVLRRRVPMPFSLRSLLRRKRGPSWRDVIIAAGLPRMLAVRAADVIRRAGLWPSERRDVARELCAHFADGLRAGRTPEELLGSFGAVKPAAKLIGRAARRKRPLWWKTWRLGLKGAAAALLLCAGVYGVGFAMAMLGTPRVTRAYAAELNATLMRAPESERAWPLYAGIRKDLGLLPEELIRPLKDADGAPLTGDAAADMWPQTRTQGRWPLAAAWVDARQEPIERLRKAAAMPTLGCPLYQYKGEGSPWEQTQTEQGSDLTRATVVDDQTSLLNILLPFCSDSRYLARILVVDARRGIELRDTARFSDDAEAMIGLAMQVGENGTLIGQLVRLAILAQTCDVIREGLAASFLDEESLARIGHRLGGTGDAAVRVTFDLEKSFLLDVVQRTYTDNGVGGGHLTYEGLRQIYAMTEMWMPNDPDAEEKRKQRELELKLLSPISVLADAGREGTVSQAEKMYAKAQAEADTPFWLRGDTSTDLDVERLNRQGTQFSRKYQLLGLLMPAFGKAGMSGEQTRQVRDGTLVAIALEAHRRAHGKYPATLGELVPRLLPAVPLDRYDGRGVKYQLVGDGSDAKPVVYSVGVDRMDDGGFGPQRVGNEYSMYQYRGPATVKAWLASPQAGITIRGDWILYDPANLNRRLGAAAASNATTPTSNR